MKKKIYIPHLHYTINIKEFKKYPDNDVQNVKAYVESFGIIGCNLYIEKKITPGDLAHEIIHILQFICLHRNMTFALEHEHMAYLMQWLMAQILGYEWKM